MKLSEKIWVEKLALASLTRPCQEAKNHHIVQQYKSLFLEELCSLVVDYISYFNEIISNSHNAASESHLWSLFYLSQPRIGIIATRGKDKLVVTDEGKSVQIRMMQSFLENERLLETLYFDPKISELGTLNWRCANDGQYVNPELVVKNYLSSFFVYGCKGVSQSYPRLVAVGGAARSFTQ